MTARLGPIEFHRHDEQSRGATVTIFVHDERLRIGLESNRVDAEGKDLAAGAPWPGPFFHLSGRGWTAVQMRSIAHLTPQILQAWRREFGS